MLYLGIDRLLLACRRNLITVPLDSLGNLFSGVGESGGTSLGVDWLRTTGRWARSLRFKILSRYATLLLLPLPAPLLLEIMDAVFGFIRVLPNIIAGFACLFSYSFGVVVVVLLLSSSEYFGLMPPVLAIGSGVFSRCCRAMRRRLRTNAGASTLDSFIVHFVFINETLLFSPRLSSDH